MDMFSLVPPIVIIIIIIIMIERDGTQVGEDIVTSMKEKNGNLNDGCSRVRILPCFPAWSWTCPAEVCLATS